MDLQQRSLRIGAAAVAGAVLLRMLSGGFLAPALTLLTKPQTVAVLMYLETGRVIRTADTLVYPPESPIPQATSPAAPAQIPRFTGEDADTIALDNETDYDPDLAALLTRPLSWELRASVPTVLILHTHTTESYTPGPGEVYAQTSEYRTLDENHNMLSVGQAVAARLEAAGIGVIHLRQLHDYPSYNDSYANARASVQAALAQTSSICLVLDLHRDAAPAGDGQLETFAQVNGQEAAQLMLVVGTDDGGLYHPDWEENLALALKLHSQLESANPGLCRPINLCAQRFNADLSPGTLLVEVGAAGDSREKALVAAEALADSIIALAQGANRPEDSTSPVTGPGP